MTWWDPHYPYRRNIQLVSPPGGVKAGHPVTATIIANNTIAKSKMRQDLADLEVVHLTEDLTSVWTVLSKAIDFDGTNIKVTFNLLYDIEENQTIKDIYYIYYGNPTLLGSPVLTSYVPVVWPVTASYKEKGLSYTRPGDDWAGGVTNTPLAKATFIFSGTAVRILSAVGPYCGLAQVNIDNGDWTEVDLYSSSLLDNQPVYTNLNLTPNVHTLRFRSTGRKNPAALDTSVNIANIQYFKYVIATDLGEQIDNLLWDSVIGGIVT